MSPARTILPQVTTSLLKETEASGRGLIVTSKPIDLSIACTSASVSPFTNIDCCDRPRGSAGG
jgi:hypothetical protein